MTLDKEEAKKCQDRQSRANAGASSGAGYATINYSKSCAQPNAFLWHSPAAAAAAAATPTPTPTLAVVVQLCSWHHSHSHG